MVHGLFEGDGGVVFEQFVYETELGVWGFEKKLGGWGQVDD